MSTKHSPRGDAKRQRRQDAITEFKRLRRRNQVLYPSNPLKWDKVVKKDK